jgi:phosphatidate cytidylyltransferase
MIKNFFSHEVTKRIITGIGLGIILFGTYLYSSFLFSILLLGILIIALFFEWPKLMPINTGIFWLITPWYPILPVASLIYLNHAYYSIDKLIPLYPIIVAWVSDTGSFVLGKTCGKHKICPTISPGKSWEGLLGGITAVTVLNFFLKSRSIVLQNNLFYQHPISIIIVSIFLAVFGFLGDIFISFLKRRHNVKDTGKLLPGHGGILDRFDAVFFLSVIMLILFF